MKIRSPITYEYWEEKISSNYPAEGVVLTKERTLHNQHKGK